MRLLLAFLLFTLRLNAQETDYCKQPLDISEIEREAHRPLFMRELNTQASGNFHVSYLRCRWEVDPSIRFIKGEVTVYFRTTENVSGIMFDLMSQLITDNISSHSIPLNFTQPDNTLTIQFPTMIPAGTLDSLTIFYHGVPANTGFGSFITSDHSGIPAMWSLSEPYGARDWFPCKNGLGEKTDSIDVYIIHPSIYKAASNGLLQSESPYDAGRTITWWKHRYPIATYLICFAVTNYSTFTEYVQLGSTSLPMVTYCYPESLVNFQITISRVLFALQLFNLHFGEYPFIKEKYGHVQFSWGGGMEHQTSTFIVSNNENLVAHELAHQWFGDKITCGSWEDIWLNEGFATHMAAFLMETKYPATITANRQIVLDNITSLPGGSVKVNDTTDVGRIFSSRLSYNKGSYLLYMLRLKLGDSAFFKGIRNYQSDPELKYHFARTSDFKRHMESESGQNLTQFFKQWYEGEGFPSYDIKWDMLGTSNVRFRIFQTTSHLSVPFFEMPVPLLFKNGMREKLVLANNTANGQVFIEPLDFIPDTVLIDPQRWLISKNNFSSRMTFPAGDPGVDISPNPFGELLKIYFHDLPADAAQVILYNALGQKILQQSTSLINGSEITFIHLSHLAKGSYFIRIIAGDYKYSQQLLR